MTFRDLPSVDELINSPAGQNLVNDFGRSLAVHAIRSSLAFARSQIGNSSPTPTMEGLLARAGQELQDLLQPSLTAVINATGVILHTNLGRAPLSAAAQAAVHAVAHGFSSLEFELARGSRGSRQAHVEALLKQACEAPSALVVNNNAGAVLLALTSLAAGQDAIISRTQLVEIGGGFRIPDVMLQSGARLVEVGTTNRTHLRDYRQALSSESGMIVRAHHSNFRLVGFTTEPSLAELASLSREHKIPLLDDLGSGALLDTAEFGLGHEPTVQESLQAGASVVAFSGDKLLGGPQSGILVGESEIIDKLRGHPLARALRPDKLCLAALAATLRHYLLGEARLEIPVWQMISADPGELGDRARSWASELGAGNVIEGQSTVGGGSLPEEVLPTWVLALPHDHADRLSARLRKCSPPIVGRIADGQLIFDPRTVLPGQDEPFLQALKLTLTGMDESQ